MGQEAMGAEEGPGAPHPGDLARRISHRRQALGLSVEQLAGRAGVDPAYLRYFERSSQQLSVGTLRLIARALETSPAALLGGDVDRPPSHGRPTSPITLEPLSDAQCRARLAEGGVGRIVFLAPRGPVALPVNFVWAGDELLFFTDLFKAMSLEHQRAVGLEIDRIDDDAGGGWSVIASGPARRVHDDRAAAELSAGALHPWAGGDRHTLVSISPREITGRVSVVRR
jgi:transcriptional regulator with XRE-family HTH domain